MQRILKIIKQINSKLTFANAIVIALVILVIFIFVGLLFTSRVPQTTTNNGNQPDRDIPINPDTGLPTIPYDETSPLEELTEEQRFQNLVRDLPYKGNGYKAQYDGQNIVITYDSANDIYRQASLMYLKSYGLDVDTPNIIIQAGQI